CYAKHHFIVQLPRLDTRLPSPASPAELTPPPARWRLRSAVPDRPQLFRIEVIIVESDVELEAIETVVVDFAAVRIEGRREDRPLGQGIETEQSFAPLRRFRLA